MFLFFGSNFTPTLSNAFQRFPKPSIFTHQQLHAVLKSSQVHRARNGSAQCHTCRKHYKFLHILPTALYCTIKAYKSIMCQLKKNPRIPWNFGIKHLLKSPKKTYGQRTVVLFLLHETAIILTFPIMRAEAIPYERFC